MPKRAATSGLLTPMPSVQLDLGRYVTVRPRKDGTARVLFEVPARLRPSDWSPAIPLPVTGERRGNLHDADEVGRIQADALRLLERLRAARLGREVGPPARSMDALNRSWQQTQFFKGKKPRTQKGYAYHAGLLCDWAKASGDKPIGGLKKDNIEQFLTVYDDRPTTRRHIKIVLKMLLDHAVDLEWRTDNPAARIKVKAPKTKVKVWEREDVMAAAWACIMDNQTPLAALMLTEWEIGQRLTDVRLFRWGAEYKPDEGAFKFWQDKTDSYVTIPVSDALRNLLDCVHGDDSLYLFVDRRTDKPFAEQRLGHVWEAIRTAAGFDKRLQVRALRHSCVVQLARSGCEIPEIAAITGHSLKSVHQILEKYLPKDNVMAWNAQKKRGLIADDAAPKAVISPKTQNAR